MRKASLVMDFLLERYTKKEPITQNSMLRSSAGSTSSTSLRS